MKLTKQAMSLCLAASIISGGCASLTTQRENTLAAAGFRTIVASTPEQMRQLETLPPGQVTPLRRGSQTIFIFPDRERHLLYVGREANYQQYRRYRLQQQITADNLAAAQLYSQPGWDAYGPWEGYWW